MLARGLVLVRCADHSPLAIGLCFFQAEDGIRDYKVTGVQTCALPIYDHPVRRLVLFPRAALLLPPRRGGMTAARGLAFAAAERVVDGVHRHAAHRRALPLPPVPPGLAELDQLVLRVPDLAHRATAGRLDQPHLAGGQPQGGDLPLLGHELHAGPCRAGHLRAAAGLELDGVDDCPHGDVAERERVARADLRPIAGHQGIAHRQPVGSEDVALLAVAVVEQRDPRAAVGVVLDVGDLRRDAVLVATEVDLTVPALVPATLVTGGDPALVVPTGLRATLVQEGLLRTSPGELVEPGDARAPASGRGRLVLADRHRLTSPSRRSRSSRPRPG